MLGETSVGLSLKIPNLEPFQTSKKRTLNLPNLEPTEPPKNRTELNKMAKNGLIFEVFPSKPNLESTEPLVCPQKPNLKPAKPPKTDQVRPNIRCWVEPGSVQFLEVQ